MKFTTCIHCLAAALIAPLVLSPALRAVDADGLDADTPPVVKPAVQPVAPVNAAPDPDKKKRADELELILQDLKDQRPDISNFNKDEWVGYVATAKEALTPFITKYPGTEETARANYKIWEVQKTAKQTEEKDYLYAAADLAQGVDANSVQILLEGAMAAAAENDYESADKYAARLQHAQVSKEMQLQVFTLLGGLALKNPNRGGPENVAAALNYAEQAGKVEPEAGYAIAANAAMFAVQVDDNASLEKAIKACQASKNPQIAQLLEKVKGKLAIAEGKDAPDFEVTDAAGKSFKLSDYKGRVVLLDFWASWCAPCREEMPNVVATNKKFAGAKFAIIGVSLDQKEEAMKAFMEKAGMTWRMVFDDGQKPGHKIAEQYFVLSIPRTILIDEKGKILAIGLRGEDLSAAVEKAVKAAPEPTPVEVKTESAGAGAAAPAPATDATAEKQVSGPEGKTIGLAVQPAQ